MSDLMTGKVRFVAYLAGVLSAQGRDALCRECRAFASTAAMAREVLQELEASSEVEAAMKGRLDEAASVIRGLAIPVEPRAQRKLGMCRLPACLLKHSRSFLEKFDVSE